MPFEIEEFQNIIVIVKLKNLIVVVKKHFLERKNCQAGKKSLLYTLFLKCIPSITFMVDTLSDVTRDISYALYNLY